jgi:hypothetical protein
VSFSDSFHTSVSSRPLPSTSNHHSTMTICLRTHDICDDNFFDCVPYIDDMLLTYRDYVVGCHALPTSPSPSRVPHSPDDSTACPSAHLHRM